ncbi:hypothetical protein K469DRAFT_685822 [Zopfia rhizophila CBS 207.26]|uniref:Uncharacterized protein n=1 Tax=Zopfia rhizophila CBS 207.26 TaxID=1314779 RepID=A0A6A6E929_9PEZI|nr:hypothetical protein K469DRAFT_685822 [Zopfia rhizophila CBS 207.26]
MAPEHNVTLTSVSDASGSNKATYSSSLATAKPHHRTSISLRSSTKTDAEAVQPSTTQRVTSVDFELAYPALQNNAGLGYGAKQRGSAATAWEIPLTEVALAAHNASGGGSFAKGEIEACIDRIERAARDLGFNLPRERFEPEKREIREWIQVQCRWYQTGGGD